jgi:hypothetical protein
VQTGNMDFEERERITREVQVYVRERLSGTVPESFLHAGPAVHCQIMRFPSREGTNGL